MLVAEGKFSCLYPSQPVRATSPRKLWDAPLRIRSPDLDALQTFLTLTTDGCATLRRVHLLGHHVISLFLLGPRFGTWLDHHRGHRGFGLVHLIDSLVSE